jgi:hypothetical protein
MAGGIWRKRDVKSERREARRGDFAKLQADSIAAILRQIDAAPIGRKVVLKRKVPPAGGMKRKSRVGCDCQLGTDAELTDIE